MTTVYSRPQITSNLTLEDHVHAPRVNDSGFDLIDILKLAITNLKSKNQSPKKAKSAKFSCSVCDKNCNINQEAIFCSFCLLNSYDFKSKLKSMPDLQELDMDENLIHKVNSDYYDLINFPKIRKTADSFSVLHLNSRSLTAHFNELQLLLSALKLNFDVIGISETKEQSSGFLSSVDLDGCIFYSQCSNTSAGGVGLYVKENLDHMIRYDLSIVEDEFETIWAEIKNAKSQNILCACTYRHPNTDIKKYIDYMDKTMSKISKENKLVFVMGDFNVNLLNYESHNETNDFINTMVSNYLLPPSSNSCY